MGEKKFSIAIPAYKGKYLAEAIRSCLAQTYPGFELVVVDDASPEDLRSIAGGFDDPRIRFYRNEKNCGAADVVDNWNICLGYCTGDYIICMGDDDRLAPTCLEDYAELMGRYPDLGVYHAQTELIDEDGEFFDMQHPRLEWESALSLLWNRWNGRSRQYIGDFCFDAARLRSNGGFYKLPLAWASDDITAVIAAEKGGIANTSRVGFQYRVNRYTISNTGNVRQKLDATLLERQWYENFLARYAPMSGTDAKYLDSIRRQLPEHFRLKIKELVVKDMEKSLRNVIYWLGNGMRYGLSRGVVADAWGKALKNRVKRIG